MDDVVRKSDTSSLIAATRVFDVFVVIAGSALGWLLGQLITGGVEIELRRGAEFSALTTMNFMLLYIMPSVLPPGVKRFVLELLTTTLVSVVWYLLMVLFSH